VLKKLLTNIKKWFDDSVGGCVRTSTCSECDEKIQTKQTILNFFSYQEVHYLKEHKHCKEFHNQALNRKELVKVYSKMIFLTGFTWVFFIVCLPLVAVIHLITFPFWWIHEKTYL